MHLQLGGYFGATHYFDEDALAWLPLDGLRPTQAAVVNIRPEHCKILVHLSLAELETATEHFRECLEVFTWMVEKGFAKLPEREEYRVEGRQYPSVTYILQHVIAKPGLLSWYAKMAKEGKDPTAERDKRAVEGSTWHKTILFFLQGKPFDLSAGPESQKQMLLQFERWSRSVNLTPKRLETKLANLDARRDGGWAGTCDAIAECHLPQEG